MENVAVAPFLHCAKPLAGSYVNHFVVPLFFQVQWSLVWLV